MGKVIVRADFLPERLLFLIDRGQSFFYHDSTMKHTIFALSVLAAFCCATLPAAYADSAPASAKAEKGKKADKKDKKDKNDKKGKKGKNGKAAKPGQPSGVVGEYMDALTEENLWVGEKPAVDAQFYIYLTSASWCGPCNAEMPHVVEQYAKMRESGRVELVLMSADRSPEAAKGFAERYHATFPVINPNSLNHQMPPGFTPPQGIPNAIIVDSEGKVIRNGHGAIVTQWENLTINNPDYLSKAELNKLKRKEAAEQKKKNKKK